MATRSSTDRTEPATKAANAPKAPARRGSTGRPPTATEAPPELAAPSRSDDLRDPRYQAFLLLRVGFTVAPILFGLDKFLGLLTDWDAYLAPWIVRTLPGDAHELMYVVGAVEIVAGLAVALRPRFGGWLVAAWLGGIILNLLTHPGFYDVALRDFGLLLAAVTLARLADVYDRPRPATS